jgi:mannose-6-phosphate isomerase-like protein (cupin superfamily)
MDKDFFERIAKGQATVEGPPFLTHSRHWGASVVLDANTRIHFIEGEPSAHYHKYRTEDYVLYSGEIDVYRGVLHEDDLEKTVLNLKGITLKPGDRVVIPPNTVHIPINRSDAPSTFIEISHGPYAEEDVVRIYDKNGRDPDLAARWLKLGYKPGVSVKDLIPLIKDKRRDT